MNVGGLLSRAALQHGELAAVRFGDNSLTYAELCDRAMRLGRALLDLGLEAGDRVALLQANGPAMVESMFGAWAGGMTIVPINSRTNAREAAYVIANSEARAVIYGGEYEDELLDSLDDLSGVHLISLADGGRAHSFEDLIDTAPPLPQVVERGLEDTAWLFYTSGTTGRPKGAMLSHRNLRQMVLSQLADVRSFEPGEPVLHAAPLSHGSGCVLLSCIARGASNVIFSHRSFDGGKVLDVIRAERIRSIAFLAPTQIVILNRAAAGDGGGGGMALESVCYGGAPMFAEDLRDAMATFGSVFVQIYGQGEAPMTISVLPISDHIRFEAGEDPRITSAGLPRTDVEIRVVGEDGEELPIGERGEVLVRGDVVMEGYWGNAEATDDALRDGWLRTGDIGLVDVTGYLHLLDRSKDMIISGGNNIYPREVEEALLLMQEIQTTAVIGVPDPFWGESVLALVVPSDGAELTEAAVIEHCRNVLSSYKKPSSVEFVTELPTSAYGKVLKRELRAERSAGGTRKA
jgi:acyl-CoA synthetase (AMP-forming)/AMP-acid ligase II